MRFHPIERRPRTAAIAAMASHAFVNVALGNPWPDAVFDANHRLDQGHRRKAPAGFAAVLVPYRRDPRPSPPVSPVQAVWRRAPDRLEALARRQMRHRAHARSAQRAFGNETARYSALDQKRIVVPPLENRLKIDCRHLLWRHELVFESAGPEVRNFLRVEQVRSRHPSRLIVLQCGFQLLDRGHD